MVVPEDWPDGEVWVDEGSGKRYIKWKGSEFAIDEDGFLASYKDWNTDWMDFVRSQEGIPVWTESHLKVINFLRTYFMTHGSIPTIRVVVKGMGITLSGIYDLFPSGPALGACRASGVPRPTGCLA